ncbi:C-type lectin domain family 10 member A [Bagarius yarrelli]|uniref:C-type lectin domain family 10 member A n=1 Tax=Bagarius yarrelli TaxID=175774 RepID=A0A556U8J2_BAGYA|nr:C-type lectin domain family 10 member A [Bagarius yarrelli]
MYRSGPPKRQPEQSAVTALVALRPERHLDWRRDHLCPHRDLRSGQVQVVAQGKWGTENGAFTATLHPNTDQQCFCLLMLYEVQLMENYSVAGVDPLILSVPYRYYLIQRGKNWNDARAYCQAEYIDLAITRNAEDMVQLQNKAQTQQFSSSAWIALYIETDPCESWKWTNQSNFLAFSWIPGKPDNAGGTENCGYVNNGQVGDAMCSDIKPFFCYTIELFFMSINRQSNNENEQSDRRAALRLLTSSLRTLITGLDVCMSGGSSSDKTKSHNKSCPSSFSMEL